MQFTLTSDEGLPLRGNLDIPGDANALLIGIDGSKPFYPWLSEFLTPQRVAMCRFEMSRPGSSYEIQIADLRTAIRHAQTRADLPTFVLGHDHGALVAVFAAEDVPKLRGVIAWSPAMIEPARRAASRLHVPLLTIYGGHDTPEARAQSHELVTAARDSLKVIIGSAGHDFTGLQLELAGAITCSFISGYGE